MQDFHFGVCHVGAPFISGLYVMRTCVRMKQEGLAGSPFLWVNPDALRFGKWQRVRVFFYPFAGADICRKNKKKVLLDPYREIGPVNRMETPSSDTSIVDSQTDVNTQSAGQHSAIPRPEPVRQRFHNRLSTFSKETKAVHADRSYEAMANTKRTKRF